MNWVSLGENLGITQLLVMKLKKSFHLLKNSFKILLKIILGKVINKNIMVGC